MALNEQEKAAEELELAETIDDCEISPAAFIFEQTDQKDELNLYEEK